MFSFKRVSDVLIGVFWVIHPDDCPTVFRLRMVSIYGVSGETFWNPDGVGTPDPFQNFFRGLDRSRVGTRG